MKIRSRWLLGVLVILLAISLVLTAFIVLRPVEIFSPNSFSNNVTSTNQNTSTQTRANYLMEDVFRPIRLIYSSENQFRMTTDASILQSANNALNQMFKDLSKREVLTQAEYEQLLLRDSYGQLLFDAPVSFGIMTRYFSDLPDEYKDETFTRIVYLVDSSREVYFVNDETKQTYLAHIDSDMQSLFVNWYDSEKFYSVESYILKQKQIFMEIASVKMEQKTYLMEQIPISFYITQLFANPSELRNRSDGQSIIYNDNLSQLKMERDTNVISYYQNRVDDEKLQYTEQLQQSFAQMKRLGGWLLGMSFANFDKNHQRTEYMRYVDSYPILANPQEGLSQFIVTSEGIEKMRVSSLIAQTPIPSRNKVVQLLSGRELIEQLLGNGIDLKSLEDIRIGYSWQVSSESSSIVEFVPNWYIRENNVWKTSAELMQKSIATTNQINGNGGDSDGL